MNFLSRKCNVKITQCIADAPKRAVLKAVKQFNSRFGCGQCKIEGATVKKGKRIIFPDLQPGPLRTDAWHRHIVDQIRAGTLDENSYGIYGRSVLLRIPDFDIIKGVLPEYMHSMCLGVTKALFQLTFYIDVKKKGRTHSKAEMPKIPAVKIIQALASVKVPPEFSRRVRSMKLGVWKAEEFRNLILFFFPVVLELLEKMRDKAPTREVELAKGCWTSLAVALRACCLSDEEFKFVSKDGVEQHQTNYIDCFRRLHVTPNYCTYNTHQVLHLLTLRETGPLPENSAFPFEGSYNRLRRSFVAGTPNICKQMINHFFHRQALGHACKRSISASEKQTDATDQSVVYQFNRQTGRRRFFRIFASSTTDFAVREFRLVPVPIDFMASSEVGWYKYLPHMMDRQTLLARDSVTGRGIVVGSYIMTIPNSCLRETFN